MSLRFRICLWLWIAVAVLTVWNQSASAQTKELTPALEVVTSPPAPALPADEEWTIVIQPALKLTANPTTAPVVSGNGSQCDECASRGGAGDYATIYQSIPFNRAEYNANPSYRHDATMEIFTGNARHLTVVRHNNLPVRPAAVPVRPIIDPLNPARYGYLRPSLRLNYYRYFPSLNPYVNVWNYTGAF